MFLQFSRIPRPPLHTDAASSEHDGGPDLALSDDRYNTNTFHYFSVILDMHCSHFGGTWSSPGETHVNPSE